MNPSSRVLFEINFDSICWANNTNTKLLLLLYQDQNNEIYSSFKRGILRYDAVVVKIDWKIFDRLKCSKEKRFKIRNTTWIIVKHLISGFRLVENDCRIWRIQWSESWLSTRWCSLCNQDTGHYDNLGQLESDLGPGVIIVLRSRYWPRLE